MSPGNGKGRPRQGDPNPSNVQNLDNDQNTPALRRMPVWHAYAEVRVVVGRGGRPRLVLLVTCPLPSCRQQHLHQARLPFLAAVRTGACGGRYTVHAATAAVAA